MLSMFARPHTHSEMKYKITRSFSKSLLFPKHFNSNSREIIASSDLTANQRYIQHNQSETTLHPARHTIQTTLASQSEEFVSLRHYSPSSAEKRRLRPGEISIPLVESPHRVFSHHIACHHPHVSYQYTLCQYHSDVWRRRICLPR